MKKTLFAAALALGLLAATTGAAADRIEICHKGQPITVSINALAAHLAHGDVEGDCTVEPPPDGCFDCE